VLSVLYASPGYSEPQRRGIPTATAAKPERKVPIEKGQRSLEPALAGVMPVCFVHVGTHKTGTTSIQRTFAAHDELFARSGTYFPNAGRPDPQSGHHNLAWELNDDPRFDPALGTCAQMLAEIAEQRPPRACLSSEDFEYLHTRPERLRALADGLRAIGYVPVAVVYLRPQAGYAESLYAELVKYGFAQTFDAYLDSILINGEVRFDDRWCFTFDYERLLDGFSAIFGRDHVIARSYDTGSRDVVDDFRQVIGAGGAGHAERIVTPGRLNAALSFADVLQRVERNAGALRGGPAAGPVPRVRARGRFDPVQLPEVRRIVDRFNAGNARVYERYGALVPCVSGRDVMADFGTALGLNPASRRRRHVLNAQARSLDPQRRNVDLQPRIDVRAATFRVAASARSEAVIVLAAAAATLVSVLLGLQSARTAFVEFGLLSCIFAATAAGRIFRATAEANGVLLDYRFFDEWGRRLRAAGFIIVGLYAVINAVLDIGVPRFGPDNVSFPGTLATAAAALVVSVVAIAEQRPLRDHAGVSARAGRREDRSYIAFGAVVLLLEAAHAVAPAWWLDTALDLFVVVFAVTKLQRLWQMLGVANALDERAGRPPAAVRQARTTSF
jgi:hypothetical protein